MWSPHAHGFAASLAPEGVRAALGPARREARAHGELLRTTRRGGPARHATLERAID